MRLHFRLLSAICHYLHRYLHCTSCSNITTNLDSVAVIISAVGACSCKAVLVHNWIFLLAAPVGV